MESECLMSKHPRSASIQNSTWNLRRFGRFIPKGKAKSKSSSTWKVCESGESSGQLSLSLLASGHLLVSQGQELLEGFSLLDAQSFLKIQQKSDSLLFNMTVQGEARLFRLQFSGSSDADAAVVCVEVVKRLQAYLPVQELVTSVTSVTPPEPNDPEQPGTSSQMATENTPQAATSVAMGTLSIKHLSQFFLGERALMLPVAYQRATLPSGDLEPLLRLCLLDCGFPAFVEEVEAKLKEMVSE